jgi:GT2 family glycosyltransferase
MRASIDSVAIAASRVNVQTDFVIVDNGGGVDYRAELGAPNIRVMGEGVNLGFGEAVNTALQQCDGESILLMNPDSTVRDDIFAELVKAQSGLEDEQALFGCLLINGGVPQVLAYNLWWSSLGLLLNKKKWTRLLGEWIEAETDVSVPRLCGAGLFGNAELLRGLGPFDASFFLYGEDVDLSLRAKAAGVDLRLVPTAVILHDAGTSSDGSSELVARAQTDAFFRIIAVHRSYLKGLAARIESVGSVLVGMFFKPKQSTATRKARLARLREVRRWGFRRMVPRFDPKS